MAGVAVVGVTVVGVEVVGGGVVGGGVVGGAVVGGAVVGTDSGSEGCLILAVVSAISAVASLLRRSPTPDAIGTARQNTVTIAANVMAGARRS